MCASLERNEVATLAASWVLAALLDMALVVPTVVVALAALAPLALPLVFHLSDLPALAFSLLATNCWMASQWGQLHAK